MAKMEEQYNYPKYYIKEYIDYIREPEYRKLMSGVSGMSYKYLRAYIIRGYMNNDLLNIKRDYYDKGKLACSFTSRKIAEACFSKKDTVLRGLKKLEEGNVIKIVKKGKFRIYIFGEWEFKGGKKIECYFIDNKFNYCLCGRQ